MQWNDRIGRRLKLRDLHTLLAVAQFGSMARAASHLAVTQPAISKALGDMEHTLGVRLLERTPQGVEPTQYGRALLKWGAVVFDDVRQAIKEIEHLADPTSGEVRIGATEPMVEGLLPAVIGPLSLQYPRIHFRINRGETVPDQYQGLRNRHVDFLIGRIPRALMDEDLHTEVLFDEPMHVVAGITNRWVRRRKIELAELVDEPWSLPRPDSFVGSLVAEAFQASGLSVPKTGVVCNSIRFHYALVASGRYLAFFPGSLLRLSPTQLPVRILPVKLPVEPTAVGIVRLKNRALNPVSELFIEHVRAVARPLAGSAPRRSSP